MTGLIQTIFILVTSISCCARARPSHGPQFSIGPLSRSLHMLPLPSGSSSPVDLGQEGFSSIHSQKRSDEEKEETTPESFDEGSNEESCTNRQGLKVNGGSTLVAPRIGGGNLTESTEPHQGDQVEEPQQPSVPVTLSHTAESSPHNESSALSNSSFHPIHLESHSGVDPHMLKKASKYAKRLKNRNRLNLKRKVLHAGFGLFFASLNQIIPRHRFVPGMIVLTSGTLFVELMRFRKGFGWMNDALHFCLGSALRKQEMEGKFTGSFYYFFGVTLTTYFFPKDAASIGICQLALADPSASFFGRQTRHIYWSRIDRGLGGIGRNKGILGFLGGALFCVPFNYRMLSICKWGAEGVPGGKTALLTASVALGVAGAFADLLVPTPALTMPKKVLGVPVPPFHVDDNFVVPLLSAMACTKIFDILSWPQTLEMGKLIYF